MSARVQSLPRTLVRLKLQLLVNRARSSSQARGQMLAAAAATVVFGGAGAIVGHAVSFITDLDVLRTVLVVGATVLTLGWAVLPLLTFGTDESLDPGRLVLFPLRRTPLMRGLLLASFVGPAPATAVLVVLGTTVGLATKGSGLVAVAAMVLLLLLSAATARTLSTALAASLTSRRGRDITVIVASILALSVQALRFVHFWTISHGTLLTIDSVLRWLPPGMLGQAAFDARTGRLGIALPELVPAAVAIWVLLRVWGRALERSMVSVTDGETSRRRVAAPADSPLLFRRLGFLAAAPWGAVTAKELRYVAREPRRKVTLVNSVIIGAGVPIWVALRSSGDARSRSVLLATLAGYIAVLGSSNQFGFDGPASWLDVVAGDTMQSVLVGKNVAVLLEIMPIVAVVGTGIAALTGGWSYLPGALLFALAGLGAGLALANNVSVRYPVRLPETRNPFGASAGGQGCVTSVVLGLCALAENLMLVPVLLAGLLVVYAGPAWLLLVGPLSVAYGAILWWGGLRLAVGWGNAHRPEILTRVDPRRT